MALFLQNVNQFSCAMNSVLLKEPQFKACNVLVSYHFFLLTVSSHFRVFYTPTESSTMLAIVVIIHAAILHLAIYVSHVSF